MANFEAFCCFISSSKTSYFWWVCIYITIYLKIWKKLKFPGSIAVTEFKCPFCERTYGFECNWRAHIREQHQGWTSRGESIRSQIAGKNFTYFFFVKSICIIICILISRKKNSMMRDDYYFFYISQRARKF